MSNPSDPNQPGGWGQSPQPGWGQPQQPGGWDQPAPPPPGGGSAPGGWQQPFPGGGGGGGGGWDQQQGAYGAPPGYQAYSGYGGGGYGGGYGGGQLAGWWLRVGATFIDGILFGILYAIFAFGVNVVVGYLVLFVGQAIYQVLLLSSRGQTLGMMATSTKVVRVDGQPVSAGTALLRWFVEFILSLLFGIGFLLDVLWPLWDDKNQTIHDKAAGTLVIRSN